MRIAMLALGTEGDVRPLIALGAHLRERQWDVTIGAAGSFRETVRARELEYRYLGHGLEPVLTQRAALLLQHPLRTLRLVGELLRAEIDASFEPALELARDARLVVSGLHPVASSVAEAAGVPHRTLLFSPQVLRSRHHPPPGFPWLTWTQGWNELLWGLVSHTFDIGVTDTLNRHRRRHRLEPIRSLFEHMLGPAPIVASSPALGTLAPDAPHDATQVGALVMDDGATLDPELERFLERGDPPIYVGFGSMPDPDPRGTTHIIVDALGACGRRGVLLTGQAHLGKGGVPPGVLVVSSPPHQLLLPRVAAAVHHGGPGTTHAVARAGVPQIVVPHLADQFYWGYQIWQRGLGPRPVPRRGLSAAPLAAAMREALADAAMTARAEATSATMAREVASTQLERLLSDLVATADAGRIAEGTERVSDESDRLAA